MRMPAHPEPRANRPHQVLPVVVEIRIELVPLELRMDGTLGRRPVSDDHVHPARLGGKEIGLREVMIDMAGKRPFAIPIDRCPKIHDAIAHRRENLRVRAPEIRVPGRAPEAHAIDGYALGDQVVQVRLARRQSRPVAVNLAPGPARVVLVIPRHIDHRGDLQLPQHEFPCEQVRPDVSREHQQVTVGYRVERGGFRHVALAPLEVQVRCDLDFHVTIMARQPVLGGVGAGIGPR